MKALRWIWRWSFVVTVPVALFYLVWASETCERFWTFGVRYDSPTVPMKLLEIGNHEARQMLHRGKLELAGDGGRSAVGPDDLRLISLFVTESNLAKLGRNLPHSGLKEVPGKIWYRGSPLQCKVRYRGDIVDHWAHNKKSWRIKTKRTRLWEGMRKFNLVSPKYNAQINNFIGYTLAREMGLMAPRCELVQVAVNGRLQGVHLLVEQIGELTLRQSGYMPGDLYAGELIGKDFWVGLRWNSVFEHPEVWRKPAINNHYEPEARAPLKLLAWLVRDYPTEATHRELLDVLDLDVWARFSVFEAVTQCFHYDEAHNWRIYYDANRRKFIPVIWDPVALQPWWRPRKPGDTRIDVEVSRFHAMLYQNAEFLRARHKAMVEFFATGMDKRFLAITDEINSKVLTAIQNDPFRRPVNIVQIGDDSVNLWQSLQDVTVDLKRAYLEPSGNVKFAVIDGGIALEVTGRQPVSQLRIRLSQPPRPTPSVRVRYKLDGKDHDVGVSGACSVSGSDLVVDVGLLSQLNSFVIWTGSPLRNIVKTTRPAYYEVIFDSEDSRPDVVQVQCVRGTKPELVPLEKKGLRKREMRAMFGLVKSQPIPRVEHVSGEIDVASNQEVRGEVVIAAGTTFRMHPGASIRFSGRVTALGTKDQPIRFLPLRGDQAPWGAVVLQGMGTSGSEFRHCEFARGSGWKDPLFEYSAMFSVHDSKEVVVRDCHFRDSQIVDDMVHTVYADIEFHGCTFERAPMDALDMDICTGKVIDCVFRYSGNDSLDLMTTRVVVQGTKIFDSGDKGISIGEDTTLFASEMEFIRCAIGIEGKDSSRAYIYTSRFQSCGVDINAYKKNWRYGDGGHVLVHNCQFLGVTKGVLADKFSSVSISNSFLDRKIASTRRIQIDASNDFAGDWWKERARAGMTMELPDGLRSIDARARPHFKSLDFTRRGPR